MACASPIMTEDEAAKYLQTSTFVLRREVKKGTIPGVRMGVKWRFHRDALTQAFFGEKLAANASATTAGAKGLRKAGAK